MPPRPESTPPPALTRRAVLLGAVGTAGLGLLAACSSTSETSTTGEDAGSAGSAPPQAGGGGVLIAVFDPNSLAVAGVENRLAFAVGDADGVPLDDGPDALTFTITSGGAPVGDPITVPRYDDGTPIAYYPLRFTPATAAVHTVSVEIDGETREQAFKVNETSPTGLVQPGDQLVDVPTPTTTDALGVDPICTQRPEPCPLHDVSLTDAIATGGPIALLFSTPAFCQTGVCGPVLDLVNAEVETHPDTQFIHCEIYKEPPTSGTVTLVDAVESFGLTYEPSLYVADASGTVTARLDNVFDTTEIREALASAQA